MNNLPNISTTSQRESDITVFIAVKHPSTSVSSVSNTRCHRAGFLRLPPCHGRRIRLLLCLLAKVNSSRWLITTTLGMMRSHLGGARAESRDLVDPVCLSKSFSLPHAASANGSQGWSPIMVLQWYNGCAIGDRNTEAAIGWRKRGRVPVIWWM